MPARRPGIQRRLRQVAAAGLPAGLRRTVQDPRWAPGSVIDFHTIHGLPANCNKKYLFRSELCAISALLHVCPWSARCQSNLLRITRFRMTPISLVALVCDTWFVNSTQAIVRFSRIRNTCASMFAGCTVLGEVNALTANVMNVLW